MDRWQDPQVSIAGVAKITDFSKDVVEWTPDGDCKASETTVIMIAKVFNDVDSGALLRAFEQGATFRIVMDPE